jgi:uncharacterized protein with ParB-like and HNH nuclease domain
MQPSKMTIHEVFERERRYDIPLYQRAYIWKEEDDWEPLWEDIRKQALRFLDASAEQQGTHFLGAVVWGNNAIVGRAIARAAVVDGQQRLTTLQLCIAALRDSAIGIDDQVAGHAKRWTTNTGYEADEELKVWPSNADREVFGLVMRAGGPEAVRKHFASEGRGNGALPRIAEAYLYFTSAIQEFLVDKEVTASKADRLHAIVQAMRAALQFVVIELEAGDDPQIIFETLNARGQPLLPSDLVRNFVFLKASQKGGNTSDHLYETYWRHFDNLREAQRDDEGEDRFWHIEERQGRFKRPRIDLFLFHYLTLKTERELNIGQLFKEFREWRSGGDEAIEPLLRDLKTYSERFARLVVPTGSDRLSVFARRLKSLDTSTVYPLLLFLDSSEANALPRDQLEQTIVDIESFLIRRLVLGLTPKNYNKFFLALLVKAKRAAGEGASIADAVREELLRSSEKTAVWPSDEEFRKAWVGNVIYVKSRADRAEMLLRAIEEKMRTPRSEAIILPTSLTVEHLLPQKGSLADYPYAAEMPLGPDETPERCRARLIHSIGNLTLLTHNLNASVSNGPFCRKNDTAGKDETGKRDAIAAESDLRLNAWLRRPDAPKAWSEREIVERSERLFSYALEIWPKPADGG